MKRTLVGLILIALVLIGSSAGLTTLQAAPALLTTQAAPVDWGAGALVRVKASIPFVWVRATWSTTGAVRATAPSGDYLVVVSAAPLWDGLQWWWNVRWGNVVGYVEQESLELVIQGATATPTTIAPTPTQVPTATAAAPTPVSPAPFTPGSQLRIIASVPFVWVRASPSSTSQVIDTAYANSILVVVSGQTWRAWDGVQWWDWVARMGVAATGWVEENRVQLASTVPGATSTPIVIGPTPTPVTSTSPAAWTLGSLRSVKGGIPFAWIRSAPLSNGAVLSTIYPGWLVLIADGTPVWDGVQWWWKVVQPARNVQGWVEQTSLL